LKNQNKVKKSPSDGYSYSGVVHEPDNIQKFVYGEIKKKGRSPIEYVTGVYQGSK
jgi:hypothetical protein